MIAAHRVKYVLLLCAVLALIHPLAGLAAVVVTGWQARGSAKSHAEQIVFWLLLAYTVWFTLGWALSLSTTTSGGRA